jgi:hypothetical protein
LSGRAALVHSQPEAGNEDLRIGDRVYSGSRSLTGNPLGRLCRCFCVLASRDLFGSRYLLLVCPIVYFR